MNLGTIVIIDAVIETISDCLNNLDLLNTLLEELTQLCELTKVRECVHKFEPQGYTICHVLAESHISIHTWPEYNSFAMDIYSCKHDLDIERIKKKLDTFFLFKTFNIHKHHRTI